ncbi:MAG: 2-amino-4-hydroxy-6-hydroxymethyldihydropteridine diphosphokinase [Spirochaetales bacterium]|nr:2-amino-4-hydroxy-6-hydroxymethyldihydropteridine diphosphokinase [Spirochaetales bacterium]
MPDVYIGVGSNIFPEKNIREALLLLKEKVLVKTTSTFYYTPPLKHRDQDMYCNGVWKIGTTIEPYDLKFDILRQIELILGRTRSNDRYASRPIDLDILVYGDKIIRTETLTIPDLGVYTRPFLCIPLWEITPGLVLPDTGKTIKEIAESMHNKHMEPACHITNQIRKGINHG